ncbi:hypothetical protein ACLOJK_035948, partial [Asimina triloba]
MAALSHRLLEELSCCVHQIRQLPYGGCWHGDRVPLIGEVGGVPMDIHLPAKRINLHRFYLDITVGYTSKAPNIHSAILYVDYLVERSRVASIIGHLWSRCAAIVVT